MAAAAQGVGNGRALSCEGGGEAVGIIDLCHSRLS